MPLHCYLGYITCMHLKYTYTQVKLFGFKYVIFVVTMILGPHRFLHSISVHVFELLKPHIQLIITLCSA